MISFSHPSYICAFFSFFFFGSKNSFNFPVSGQQCPSSPVRSSPSKLPKIFGGKKKERRFFWSFSALVDKVENFGPRRPFRCTWKSMEGIKRSVRRAHVHLADKEITVHIRISVSGTQREPPCWTWERKQSGFFFPFSFSVLFWRFFSFEFFFYCLL